MSPHRRRTRTVRTVCAATSLLVAAGLLASCGGHKDHAAASPTPTVTPTPTPPPQQVSTASPLTGLQGGTGKPVLVVKIDNTAPAHPQVGVQSADVVYLEQVEAGLTRLAAVFSSRLPATVGPVRSARMTDIDLFAQYGRVAFAFSGAQAAVVRALHKANLNLEPDGFGGGWFRGGGGRHAPYNLFAKPASLLKARPKTALVRDVGFRFGPMLPTMRPTKGVDVRYKMATVRWRWDAAKRAWAWSMDGRPASAVGAGQITADNVIVQVVPIKASALKDVNGNHSPYTNTIGKGRAWFLRDGRVVAGSWSRPKATAGTAWMVGGRRYPMKPGRTWVILVGSGRAAQLF